MFTSSEAAEAAFYEAFSNGDSAAMMSVWAPHNEIVCIHPSGPRLDGRDLIRHSWDLILTDSAIRSFDLRGLMISGSGDVRVHMLEENISVPGTRFVAPPVLATNVYQRLADGWYMVVHHASVAPDGITTERTERQLPGEGTLH